MGGLEIINEMNATAMTPITNTSFTETMVLFPPHYPKKIQ
jgi:hypothetical protein